MNLQSFLNFNAFEAALVVAFEVRSVNIITVHVYRCEFNCIDARCVSYRNRLPYRNYKHKRR